MFSVPPARKFLAAVAAGLLLGTGLWVLHVSKGLSYLSSASIVCANCHVMNTQYATFNHSSHRQRANCVDCHLPHDNPVHYLLIKAKDGLKDTVLFLLRREQNIATATDETRSIILENCIRCHTELVDSVAWGRMGLDPGRPGAERRCWECHKDVPHGRIHGLTTVPDMELQLQGAAVPDWLKERL